MKKFRITLLVLLVGSLAACGTTHRAAPVSERSIGGNKAKSAVDGNFYTVKKGDTLYRIALDFGQSYSELVTWNRLADPNDIKVDQVLRITPPDAPVARSGGAQTGAVATGSGAEARSLAAPVGSTAGNKNGPRGEKRPYSDSTLADLQKAEGTAASTGPKTAASNDKPASAVAATDDETVSWMWPAEGKLVATFDDNKKGIDIAGKSGQQVLAAGAGKVMYAGSGIRGYGNLVIVKHTSTLLSAYAHNKTIHVKEGQSVSKGQKIADMGDSDADTVKLHFEIRQQGKPVDPANFLPSR